MVAIEPPERRTKMDGMGTGSSINTSANAMNAGMAQRPWGRQVGADMQECIQNCLDCHAICTETATYCLQMGGRHAEASHVRLLLDCAQICATSANFMLRQSDLHGRTCGVCAEVCERCAQSCEQFGDDGQMR